MILTASRDKTIIVWQLSRDDVGVVIFSGAAGARGLVMHDVADSSWHPTINDTIPIDLDNSQLHLDYRCLSAARSFHCPPTSPPTALPE